MVEFELKEKPNASRIRKNPYYDDIIKNGFSIVVHYSPDDVAEIINDKQQFDFDLLEHDPDELAAFGVITVCRKLLPIILTLAGAIFLLGACTFPNMQIITPEGPVISINYLTEDFSIVTIRGGSWEVIFRQTENHSATVAINENLLDHFNLSVENGVLTATFDVGIGFDENISNISRIYLYAPYLEGLNLSGIVYAIDWDTIYTQNFAIDAGGIANIDIQLEVEQLAVDARGITNIQLFGNTDTADINIIGSGNIFAFDLQTREAQINASGSSNINISVSENLTATVGGISHILYRGNPQVTYDISGGLASVGRDN